MDELKKPNQYTDWTRKDVEDMNKGLPKDKWNVPAWYRNTESKSKYEAMGITKK